eukprot:scaffold319523_cov31-Tisochrysis_lutea.AAC.2
MGSSLPAFPLTFVPSPFLPYFAADNNTPTAPKLEWKLIMDSDEGNDWLWNREDARALREKLEGVGLEEGASPRSMNSSRKARTCCFGTKKCSLRAFIPVRCARHLTYCHAPACLRSIAEGPAPKWPACPVRWPVMAHMTIDTLCVSLQ